MIYRVMINHDLDGVDFVTFDDLSRSSTTFPFCLVMISDDFLVTITIQFKYTNTPSDMHARKCMTY